MSSRVPKTSTSQARALLRVEKKLDVLLDKVNAQLGKGEGSNAGYVFEAPMHQTQQTCSLCKALVRYFHDDGVVIRECGCKPPI
jgi:hypothetical protein